MNRLNKKFSSSLILVAISLLAWLFYFSLPQPLFNTPLSSILLSKEGRLLGAHISSDEQWRFPPLKKTPHKFATAIIAFEDKRFYQHIGVDPLAIARAFYLNIKQGRIVSGGSTLSMQVIRLAEHNPTRTIWQKFKELFKAIRLEIGYSKEEILALYASHAPFGGNVVGLEAASWRYFGRKPEQLSWAESAMLAVLPNSPSLIHLGRHRQKLLDKRNRLLKKLYQQKTLPKLEYDLAIIEPLPNKPPSLPRLTPHLLDTLTLKYPQQQRFKTTINAIFQQRINQVAKHHSEILALSAVHNLAILVIDNQSFEVLAYMGNARVKKADKYGQAIDLIQRPRSTGSTLKPFLFAAMIEQGQILPETLIADTPVRYSGYQPRNFNRQFQGAIKAKQALARSLNIPAVNLLSQHGVESFLGFLRQMGMTTLHRKSRDYGLPLILGGAETTLWELTSLYANLAHIAQQHQPSNYHHPTVLQGAETKTTKRSEISPASAWMTLQALLDVTRPDESGYWRNFSSSHKVAWKTGTSFGHRDAWAIGTTPRYSVGVWVGNAAGEGRQELTGLKAAAPILFDVFNRLSLKNDWFEKPLGQMKKIQICQDDGFLANANCKATPYWIPKNSHFDQISPYHQRIHVVEVDGKLKRVHSQCESVSKMQHLSWFVLPPDQAFYYQQSHANYKPLPEWREDCKTLDGNTDNNPISLIYPRSNTQIYIPTDLTGERSKVVFKAIHRETEQQIYWHIDHQFIGTTQLFHQKAVYLKAGKHTLVLVDEAGNRVEQTFVILQK
ncbi:MAG TPA: penicillin-binding protein 1C [Leucothrix mucor]|uniref:peptidoglycan glycosyltransferase n=2 Tax=Leucothrix mucor TaxID=45248 RepID=A0A7V2WV47_LEUMU|nr:penicillin-binding protein 1C [Leucothrix mucor]